MLHATFKVEEGAMNPRMPMACRNWRREGDGFSSSFQKEESPTDTFSLALLDPFPTFNHQNCKIIHFVVLSH